MLRNSEYSCVNTLSNNYSYNSACNNEVSLVPCFVEHVKLSVPIVENIYGSLYGVTLTIKFLPLNCGDQMAIANNVRTLLANTCGRSTDLLYCLVIVYSELHENGCDTFTMVSREHM